MDNIGEEVVNRLYLATFFEEESLRDDQSLRGLNGLRNLGNTCYMNAALQALSNCPPLREYFRTLLNTNALTDRVLSHDSSSSDSFNTQALQPLTNAFRDVMTRLWSDSETSIITPTFFLFKLREKCAQFRGFNQQDTQEFIRCFLDALHQELRRPIKKWELEMINENDNLNYFVQPSSSTSSSPPLGDDITANDENSCGSSSAASVSSHRSTEENRNGKENENFETADSGLSSDTEDAPKSKGKKSSNQNAGKEKAFKSENNDKEKIVGYKSIITDVFDGELVSSVKCQTCHHISYTKENFQDISLSIPTAEQLEYLRDASPSNNSFVEQITPITTATTTSDNNSTNSSSTNENLTVNNAQYSYLYWIYTITSRWFFRPWYNWFAYFFRYMFTGSILLENCLKAFFSTDFLHGDDMYSCEKCAKLRNGTKQCELICLPEILCIHLKRFRHDNMYNSKVNTRVTFPLRDLDMRPFVRESILEKDENMITEYDLVAVISHRGSGIEYGHYVAYCLNEFDKNWYEFDDSLVTRVNALEVMNREAYVLFYQKKSSETMDEIRTQVQKLLRRSIKGHNHDLIDSDRYYISKEWLHKFLTFSEPGAIDNCDFLCAHGQMAPIQKNVGGDNGGDHLFSACVYITKPVWEFLQRRMGGGPECSELRECLQCRQILERMLVRKRYERKTFVRLEAKNIYADYLPPNVIANTWLEKWTSFISQADSEPPPPINNEALVRKCKEGLKLRPGANYSSINRLTWNFFYETYGGGPELFAVPFIQPTAEEVARVLAKIDQNLNEQNDKSKITSETIVSENDEKDGDVSDTAADGDQNVLPETDDCVNERIEVDLSVLESADNIRIERTSLIPNTEVEEEQRPAVKRRKSNRLAEKAAIKSIPNDELKAKKCSKNQTKIMKVHNNDEKHKFLAETEKIIDDSFGDDASEDESVDKQAIS